MATLDTTLDVPTEQAPSAEAAPGRPGATIRTAALVQWVVVGSLLAYGVSQTVLKAAALFA